MVACSRDAAVLYKESLDRLNGPASAIIISGSNDDEAHQVKQHTEKDEHKRLVERFLKPADPLSILIVCDMLITGFDAPIKQVMYLDASLKEHTLLQAIARVNRVYDDIKKYGLIVDCWGVSEALQEALAIFSPRDVNGAMTPKSDELPRLQIRHQAAMHFFLAGKDKDDLDACVNVLLPEDVRADFTEAFRRFAQSLDMILLGQRRQEPRRPHQLARPPVSRFTRRLRAGPRAGPPDPRRPQSHLLGHPRPSHARLRGPQEALRAMGPRLMW